MLVCNDLIWNISWALTWSKRHNFKHCKITWKQAFLKIVHGYVKRNRYNIDKAFYIKIKLSNNFFTKIINITWCNRNIINVAFMCNRALIWMPLWVVFLNIYVFCIPMTDQNNMVRMPIWECQCELYFRNFIFSCNPMTAQNNVARGHLWVAHIFDLSRILNSNWCLLRQRIFSQDDTIPNNLSRIC